MAKNQTKKIKIVSRGFVITSRGRCRTPIMTPYLEKIDNILLMLTRDNAKIVEVLPDNTEIELNIYNFNKDNTVKPVKEEPVIPVHVADPVTNQVNNNQAEHQLSRKERRALEHKKRMESMQKNNESSDDQTPAVEDTTAITEDAISE